MKLEVKKVNFKDAYQKCVGKQVDILLDYLLTEILLSALVILYVDLAS